MLIFFEIGIEPFPAIEEKPPSATFIFLFPEHGVYDWKSLNEFVIWSKAPESMIYEAKRVKELDMKELNRALDSIPA